MTVLSTAILEPINIHPIPCKILTTRRQTEISIEGKQKHLSYRTFQPIEVIPESSNDDDLLFTTYINGSSQTTTFICNFCYNDFTYKCSPTMRSHIQTAHRTEMDNRLRTCYIALLRSETIFFEDLNANLSQPQIARVSPPPYLKGFFPVVMNDIE